MKKTLISIAILAIALLIFAGSVNAATTTVSAEPTTAKNGDTVTYTIDLGEGMETGDFVVKYDSSLLKYESYEGGIAEEVPVEGGMRIVWMNSKAIQQLKVTFTVVADEGTANIEFVPAEGKFGTDANPGMAVNAASTTVTIGDEIPVDPVDPDDPADPVNPDNPGTPADPSNPDNSGEVDMNTDKQPGKDAQTGAPIYLGVVALAIAGVAVALVSKKN